MATIGDTFKPGQKVPNSGIYNVLHDPYHHEPHQVTCVYKEPFPPCHDCGDDVRFELAVKALHVKHHVHFKKK
jgi:hypothetical protein